MTGSVYYDPSPPHPCESLARLEGQSNFLSLLAGIEGGPDTTEDAAALGWIRDRCIPESLEAYWGRSRLYRYGLCQMVFDAINMHGSVQDRDRIWTKGAILDAFDLYTTDVCPAARVRAKRFKVDHDAYRAVRKMAGGMLTAFEGNARRPWIYVMRSQG